MNQLQVIYEQRVLNQNFAVYGTFENPLFLAKDVAEWIEHTQPSKMLLTVEEDEKLMGTLFLSGQNREMWFLTEDGLYEVLMQSRKPIAKQFKKQVKVILKEIRKTGSYSSLPSTPLEALQQAIGQMVEQEKRLGAVEQKQQQLEKQHDNIAEIISLNPTEWRKKVNAILNKIGQSRGGFGEYQKVRQESYEKLEERAKCKLEIRLRNRTREAREQGIMTKAQIGKLSKLDVIAGDARLTEIYLAIVKEMAIAYKIDVEGLDVQ